MKKQNFQYFTGLVVLGGVFYAVGAFSALGSFFAENPGSGYTCSGYGYVSGYGYGYSCSALGGGGSSVGSTSTTSTTTDETTTDEETTDETTTDEETTDETTTDEETTDETTTDEETTDETTTDGESMDEGDNEVDDAYRFGFENGLTTLPQEEARLYEGLNRSELAKMMSNFIKNVENQEAVENPVCDITTYSDYTTFDEEMKMYIKMACDYGIMGWMNDKSGLIEAFRPLDPVTREEFAAVLSRHLFGSMYDGQDMKAHLEALKNAGIMNQIDNPYVVEVRGYVLVMLQRTIAEEEAMMEDDTVDQEMPAEDETTVDEMMEDETAPTEEEVAEGETGSQA